MQTPLQNASSLKSRVFKATGWVAMGQITAQLLRLAGNLVLTRLLAPEMFGIMAIAMAIQVAVAMPADIGLEQAVIRSTRGHERSFCNTAFTLRVLRGCLIWIVCSAVAVGLGAINALGWLPSESVYATSILPVIFSAVSFSFVISGFNSTKHSVATRNIDVKSLTAIALISQAANITVGILFALVTHSIWSIVAAILFGSVVKMVLSHIWWPGPIDRFEWEPEAFQEIFHFGKWTSLSSAVTGVAAQGDRLLLGSWVSPAMLGYYSIAFNLLGVFENAVSSLRGNILLPALSEVVRQQPDRVPEVYFRMRWVIDAGFVGMAGVLFATGEWIVGVMYDVRYAPAGWMLQLLSFSLLFGRYGLSQTAYLALGRPSHLAAINSVRMISLFVMTPALYYMLGVEGAILGIAFHRMPTLLWVFWFNRRYRLNNFGLEFVVLGVWPLGWIAGHVSIALLKMIHP
jgi:O-antigen/teichoic acid export membrane protein